MNLTNDELSVIEQMAELFFSPADIAANLQTDCDTFCALIEAKQGDAYFAFAKGWIKSEIALRKIIATFGAEWKHSCPTDAYRFKTKKQT
jgi:hypothetical protein